MIKKSKVKEQDSINLWYLLIALGLFIPAFLQKVNIFGINTQFVIGTIVNAALFTCALKVNDTKKIIALSILPSISSMCSGLLFNGFTSYSALMLPFIWIGNFSLIYAIKKLNINFVYSSIVSIIIKVSVIYGGFLLVSNIFNFPSKVKTMMGTSFGINQIYTAIMGLILVLTVIGTNKMMKDNK